jgi:hypothetical protein
VPVAHGGDDVGAELAGERGVHRAGQADARVPAQHRMRGEQERAIAGTSQRPPPLGLNR